MRNKLLRCWLVLLVLLPQGLAAKSKADKERYVFFLHHMFVELYDLNTAHPEYGRAEYLETLEKFRSAGFVVISEKRPRGTDVRVYARKVVSQIDSLLKLGVKPGNITVIGCSKGGYIAQYVSTFLKNPQVNFVFIGCYRNSDVQDIPDIGLCGNVLSIYERSDTLGVSMIKRKEYTRLPITHFKEIELHTNRKHGFLYHPLDEWVQPSIEWAKGNYGVLNPVETKSEMEAILGSRANQPFNGVILIKEGDNTVYSLKTGYENLTGKLPFSDNSEFVIGSISKQFTAVLVLLEMEKGHLKLTDTIGRYLPGLKQRWKDSVTIYQLLTHTHGIVSQEMPLSFTPGSKMDYSSGGNVGYQLLSEIVEKTSGRSFPELTTALFRQCGMQHSFHPAYRKLHRIVKGYTQQTDGSFVYDSTSFLPSPAAGSMISTAGDLALWNSKLFEGKILKPETYRLFTAIQPHVIRQHPLWGKTEYGLGITIRDQDNIIQYGQTGFTSGFVSMSYYFPANALSVIALENISYETGDNFSDRFYYHARIIEMLREKLKLGQERIEKNCFIQGTDTLRYRLAYPPRQEPGRPYPLLVYLHGSGSRAHDNERPLQRLPPVFLDSATRNRYPCFLLIPQCDTNDTWTFFSDFPNSLYEAGTKSAAMVTQLVRHLEEVKDIDTGRIYLTGYSLGGEDVYALIAREPDLFACGVPLAAVGDTSKAALVSNTPVWAFHGDADHVNPIVYDSLMIDAIKRKGGAPKFTQLHGVGHNCQDTVYSNSELWEWMFGQRKR